MNRDLTAQAQADLAWLERHDAVAGVAALVAERRRQIETNGFSASHDQDHQPGWLAQQAMVKAAVAAYMLESDPPGDPESCHELAEAGAMLAAEIDRVRNRNGAA